MARLYLDENIGSRTLIVELANAHHTATFCRDLGYAKAPDDFHLYTATLRDEVLMTHDADFIGIHGALFRFARDHQISDIHAGILLFPHDNIRTSDVLRYTDAFFAAELPIANRLYVYQETGSWVRYLVRDRYPQSRL